MQICVLHPRSLGTIGGTSEDDSDYACIDRSTHSITGYLQSPTKSSKDDVDSQSAVAAAAEDESQRLFLANEFSTTSFIDSPSPYATIQVMRKQKQQQQHNANRRSHWNRPMHQYPFHTMKVSSFV